MAKALVAAGNDVHVVCGSFAEGKSGLTHSFAGIKREGIVEGISVTEYNIKYSNKTGFFKRAVLFFRFMLKTIRHAIQDEFDLVFCTSTPLTIAVPGIAAKYLRKKKFIFEVRDLWPDAPKQLGVVKNRLVLKALSLLESMAYRAADACIGLSPGMVDGIVERSPPGKPVVLIPNGCDIGLFGGKAEERAIEGVSPSDIVAAFTGAHGLANGLDAVLDVAKVLKERGHDHIKLVLVGDGMKKKALVDRATSSGLNNCKFLSPIEKNHMSGFFQRADIGMVIFANIESFYYGTSPNKFFDYIAAGLPVVVNHPGWVCDLIDEHAIGECFPPDRADLFADALVHMASDKQALNEMGERSRALALSRFDRADLARQFVEFLTMHGNNKK